MTKFIKYYGKVQGRGLKGYTKSINLPKEVCNALGLDTGTPIVTWVEGDEIRIKRREADKKD